MRKANKPKMPSDLKRIGTGRVRISASLKPGLEIELSRIAAEDGINKSQVLAQILTKEIVRRRRLKSDG
jgi:hypothetical protein